MATNYPKCPYVHEDCFALMMIGHRCHALTDTDFKKRDCPFYKPESEVDPKYVILKYTEDEE